MKELQGHLQKEEKRRDANRGELEKVTRVLLNAKAGVEHLSAKLQHIKLVSAQLRVRFCCNCLPPPAPREGLGQYSRASAWWRLTLISSLQCLVTALGCFPKSHVIHHSSLRKGGGFADWGSIVEIGMKPWFQPWEDKWWQGLWGRATGKQLS